MDREKLINYNETLKHRALTNDEWDDIKAIISRNKDNQSFNLDALCPLIAVKFNGGQKSYELFVKTVCKVLNDDPKHILLRHGIIARAQSGDLGDGSGSYIAFVVNEMVIGAMSVLEEYSKFINETMAFNDIRDEILRTFL